ncbi:MAG: glycosyl hydrolase, partial [Tannerella sp.]|nr:glycosyl hydrolase [Tannerella sp.]
MLKLILSTLAVLSAFTSYISAQETMAVPVNDFLNSIGAVSSVSRRGETLDGTVKCLKYTGIRWLRCGYEDNAPPADFVHIRKETGVRFS